MNLHRYASLLLHSPRVGLFREVIEEAVGPGTRVLDLGTGLGTYAMFAARAGAERVVAVDTDPVIHLARELARENGLEDRIEFIHGRAPERLPDERWDLVIYEDYRTDFLDRESWELLRAVTGEHLADGGRLLPGSARLVLAPVGSLQSSEWAEASVSPEQTAAPDARAIDGYGLQWSALRTRLANTATRVALRASALAAEPVSGPELTLAPPPSPEQLSLTGEWSGVRGPVEALVLWFDLELGGGRTLSNAPGCATAEWGQWLLPLETPLAVGSGETLRASVRRETLEGGAPGFIGWSVEAGGRVYRGHDFAGLLLGPEDLGPGLADTE